MLLPRIEDNVHKAWLYRLLSAFADDATLMQVLRFKGGTCAAMAGFLNRFSVDLDFDYIGDNSIEAIESIRKHIKTVAHDLGLTTKNYSKNGIQFFFKYDATPNQRNTIKVEAQFPPPQSNQYHPMYIAEIDRTLPCQTIESMFANKLVAVLDRFEQHRSIAGRDIYDIYQFFLQRVVYSTEVIEERRGVSAQLYFQELIEFIEHHVTATIIQQDLNTLLPPQEFKTIRRILKAQVIAMLKDEVVRLQS